MPKQGQSIPAEPGRKRGPGVRITAKETTGPTIQKPQVNKAAQSARSKDIKTISGTGLGDNPRVLSRDEVSQAVNYGTT